MAVSFEYIRSMFDDTWDISYLTEEEIYQAAMFPVKKPNEPDQLGNWTSGVYFGKMHNCLVFMKQGGIADYTHYKLLEDTLEENQFTQWHRVYTNYKTAAILSGLGVRAKNSLVYSYKFGFDMLIAVIAITEELVDLPERKIIKSLWKRCIGCDDCRKACPVGAIHNEGPQEMWWLDSEKCLTFQEFGDHPRIPSIKNFWHKNVYPEIPKEIVDNIKNAYDCNEFFGMGNGRLDGKLPWQGKNGFTFDGQATRKDGVAVPVPACSECTSQPRCSKWGGKFPYDKILKMDDIMVQLETHSELWKGKFSTHKKEDFVDG
jgi:ferredoxin